MSDELDRQYRVARQMVDMHSRLRDRYHLRALLLDLTILTGSVVFVATTFADSQSFSDLGLAPVLTENVLRVASVVLFFASVAALRVDWKGAESSHNGAVRRMSELVAAYREARHDDGTWSGGAGEQLSARYTTVTTSIVAIPTRQFVSLKASYLRAKEVSKLIDKRPGYPRLLADLAVRIKAVKGGGDEG